MKMKFMKKVTALFLAFAMILGMSVSVSAIGSTYRYDTGHRRRGRSQCDGVPPDGCKL